ncbi:MAG: hypothetical protein ACI9V8_002230 [Urechidicola sp.]|jgi:hypothetical protein
MKTSTIIASLLIIISQVSFANQPEKVKRPDLAALTIQLQLEDSKAKILKKIMQGHHQKMKQFHQKKQQDREEMHILRNQHLEQLLTVLDHQQLYQLESYMQQFRPQRKTHKQSD